MTLDIKSIFSALKRFCDLRIIVLEKACNVIRHMLQKQIKKRDTLIPAKLREYAGLDKDVVLLGLANADLAQIKDYEYKTN